MAEMTDAGMNLRPWLAAGAFAACGMAHAAGGHHAVDDAAIGEPGDCKVETWFSRASGGDRLLHAGTGCVIGPVELSVAGERARGDGQGATTWSAQAKWATEVAPGFSVGAAAVPAWQPGASPRFQGTTLTALGTWRARDDISLHLNFGRNFVRDGQSGNRGGIAAEWAPAPGWQLLAERFFEQDVHFARVGARWAFTEGWSVDISRAQHLKGDGVSFWTVGATWQFQRR
jgi:hypothetical protein